MFDHLDDPEPYVPGAGLRPAVERRARSLKRRRRAALGGGAAVLVVIAAVAGASTTVDRKLDQVDTVDVPSLRTTTEPGDPQVVLFVGADSDEGSASLPERTGPGRSDTILLARVDPGQETLSMLSVPRDLLVEIPGHGLDRINAALAYGGPELLVETIDQNLGIEVDRYLETDFPGAAALGDALGGVSLDFSNPVRDRQTGLDLPAGCTKLAGDQLLAVGRSRHVRYLEDGTWKADGTSDLGRMLRQQAIGRALLQRLTDVDLTDPAELNRLLDVAPDDLTIDSATSHDELIALFRAVEGSVPTSVQYPVVERVHEGAAVLELGPGADRVTASFLGIDEPQPPAAPHVDGEALPSPTSSSPDRSTSVPPWTTPEQTIPTPC